ncbi:DNA cytosine methyltransferase [Gallibacter sp. Marseille-QA0791]|uniref:DNA cytosine methyltransferase n=1 Tax=Gallibacter sp. Marseille-QA0791 TaxID=3378781 RepID=UPI003D12BA82
MRVLVACEESQAVCKAFRELGHEAYSCDIEPCSGGHPEWHIQADAIELLKMKWDMILAFPPCTYLSNAGARHLFKGGKLNEERYRKGLQAKTFFLQFLNANCPRICVENPVSSKIYQMPKHTQEIQPYQFGHPVQKKTRLWLKGLPLLKPTAIIDYKCGCHEAGTWFMKGGKDRQKNRSKTFPGIARAMAEQWGGKA